jgi:hypothetical protein
MLTFYACLPIDNNIEGTACRICFLQDSQETLSVIRNNKTVFARDQVKGGLKKNSWYSCFNHAQIGIHIDCHQLFIAKYVANIFGTNFVDQPNKIAVFVIFFAKNFGYLLS